MSLKRVLNLSVSEEISSAAVDLGCILSTSRISTKNQIYKKSSAPKPNSFG